MNYISKISMRNFHRFVNITVFFEMWFQQITVNLYILYKHIVDIYISILQFPFASAISPQNLLSVFPIKRYITDFLHVKFRRNHYFYKIYFKNEYLKK